MKSRAAVPVLLAAAVWGLTAAPSHASSGHVRHEAGGKNAPFSYAVYGDAPYGTTPTDTVEYQDSPAFIDSINADPDVSAAVHVGDIHSGSQYCTEAYDRSIAALWTHFEVPLIYTPGDNEWADCHKAKQGGGTYNPATGQIDYKVGPDGQLIDYAGGNPVANLDLVRRIFFARPGATLGSGDMTVLSQAQVKDRAHPTDAQYVENVVWEQHGVVFVTIDVPGGSNNDADPWYGAPTASDQQKTEAANRTGADLRWLDSAFALAGKVKAKGVAVITQADMWDVDGKSVAHLSNYEPIIATLASRTAAFGGPVLLLNGDSHVYRSDNPLQAGSTCTGEPGICADDAWASHPSYDVPNFHRLTVHGSTEPLEWLKLTVDPTATAPTTADTFGPFRWTRMPEPTAPH